MGQLCEKNKLLDNQNCVLCDVYRRLCLFLGHSDTSDQKTTNESMHKVAQTSYITIKFN